MALPSWLHHFSKFRSEQTSYYKHSNGKNGNLQLYQIWNPAEWILTTIGMSIWSSHVLPTSFSKFLLRQAAFWHILAVVLHNYSHSLSTHTLVDALGCLFDRGARDPSLHIYCSVQLTPDTKCLRNRMRSKFRLTTFSTTLSQSHTDKWYLQRQRKERAGCFCGLGKSKGWWINE